MDKYRIDSHKLLYHVQRVNDWLNGNLIYPIYMEISPSGPCNHRCIYCGLDYMKYQKRYLDANLLKERLSELSSLGLKSVMYAGEGEPLLHKQIADIISHTKKSKIDVGLTTNGVLLNEPMAEKILGDMEWIKVSINGATEGTYAKIHSSKPNDFNRVIKNMTYIVKLKLKNNYKCTLGMQLVLLPENKDEVLRLVAIARDIGMDYLVIKPYSQHLFGQSKRYKDIKYSDYMYLANEMERFSTKDFTVVFRIKTMKKWDDKGRSYKNCLSFPFWSYIDAGGGVWGCSAYLGDKRFEYGNIHENYFKDIWEGKVRRKSLFWSEHELDTNLCRVNCRMDEINRYLWELKNPPEHFNFI